MAHLDKWELRVCQNLSIRKKVTIAGLIGFSSLLNVVGNETRRHILRHTAFSAASR